MSADHKPLDSNSATNRQAAARESDTSRKPISRVALVSHDYNQTNKFGLFDYSEHFEAINASCDAAGCDSILYALWTWDNRSPNESNHDRIFGGLKSVQRVILETFEDEAYGPAEVWLRTSQQPLIASQRFATSSASDRQKQHFLNDLSAREFDKSILLLCGESNIASLVRATKDFSDPFGFNARLDKMSVSVIWNPIHDYMRRYEMKRKRAYYSSNGRWVLSVWNQGKPSESHTPWSVFHNGEDFTDRVVEQDCQFANRPDIRIGVLDLST